VVVDGQGLPIRLNLTAGQSHDGQAADGLLDHVGAGTIVLFDKAYDADRIRAFLRERRAFANIPTKSNGRSKPYFSTWPYRERSLIERLFSKLKHFRRIANRYEKLAENLLAMVHIGSMRL
jgi:transposase